MKKILLLLFALTLINCGARKVQREKEKEVVRIEETTTEKKDVTIDKNIKEEKKVIVNDSTKEEIEETIIEPIDKTKPFFYEGKESKNSKITKRKTKRNKAVTFQDNTNTLVNEKAIDKTTKERQKTEQSQKNNTVKHSERESLIKWWWFPLILIILFLAYKAYRKFTV